MYEFVGYFMSSFHAALFQLRLANGSDEVPTGALLRTVRMEVLAALEELRIITTHDDNLEKQYKESKFFNDFQDMLRPPTLV